jgi:hypothetical protein
MTDMNISMNAADAQKAIAAIEKQLQTLRAFVGLPAAVPAKSKKAQVSQPASDEPEKKRTLAPALVKRNEEVKALFEELKAAWAEANADYVSLDAKALAAAIKSGECEPKPLYSAALQEHSRRQREGNPEAEAKHAAYRAKVEKTRSEKSGASSVASAPSAAEPAAEKKARKNPWEGLTEEQKKERVAKMQDAKKAKKAATSAAPAPVAAAAPLPSAPKDAEVVEASEDDEEAFKPFQDKFWKNGLQYVYKKTSDGGFGDYVGRYDPLKRKDDATVPEPPVE